MENKPNKKPQLHSSHFSILWHCGHKFERIVLLGEKELPTVPLVVGTATHSGNAINLKNKIERGTLLTKEAMQDYARDSFVKAWESTPVVLTDEEVSQGIRKTRDKAQDDTIALVTEYHYTVARKIQPAAVEEPWVLIADGYPFDLAGMIDVKERYDIDRERGIFLPSYKITFRDTKTRSRDLGQREVDNSEQYTIYFMAIKYIDGKEPDEVWQDTIIKPTKTMPARVKSYKTERTQDDIDVFHRRFEQTCKIIEKETFTPASPTDWWCSKEHCGFAAAGTCKFFNSRRGPIVTKTEPEKNGGTGDGKQTAGTDGKRACEALRGILEN